MQNEVIRDLSNVKVGDKLAVKFYSSWTKPTSLYNFLTVERVTPTQVVTTNGDRFKKLGGNAIGATNGSFAFVAEEKHFIDNDEYVQMRKREIVARQWLEDVAKNPPSVEKIEAIKALLESLNVPEK